MAFILICHFLQYFDNELTWWFNVGLQIFLCISGYLYGRRGVISDDYTFIKKNVFKILIDYYVVIIPAMILFVMFSGEQLELLFAMKVLLLVENLGGGEHMWYLPYCLLCYLITPFLSRFFDRFKERRTFLSFLILCLLTVLSFGLFVPYFNPTLIVCYIIGFFLGTLLKNERCNLYRGMSVLIHIAAVLSNAAQIVIDYVLNYQFEGTIASIYRIFCSFAHVALGASIFVLFKWLFERIFTGGYPSWLIKICSFSDKYSYDVYLVHHFMILGPLSLMKMTGLAAVNILLILIFIVALAVIANVISGFVRRLMQKVIQF